jgi:hypothetical protein
MSAVMPPLEEAVMPPVELDLVLEEGIKVIFRPVQ